MAELGSVSGKRPAAKHRNEARGAFGIFKTASVSGFRRYLGPEGIADAKAVLSLDDAKFDEFLAAHGIQAANPNSVPPAEKPALAAVLADPPVPAAG